MICIKSIEVLEVEREHVEMAHLTPPYQEVLPIGEESIEIKVLYEMVRGRRFINHDGKEVCIGMTKQVQDAIGLPFAVFENMEKKIGDLQLARDTTKFKLDRLCCRLNNTGFWGRLKWLFRGVEWEI